MVSGLDLRSRRSPVKIPAAALGKLFTHTYASVTKQYNLVPAQAGKVTVIDVASD